MFVGAQLAHLGQRAREACQRPRTALGFGALRPIDMAAADDDFDLRQFPLYGAGDALDQREPDRRRRIAEAMDRAAPAAHLPFGDRGARRPILRIDGDRFGADVHPVGVQRLLALLNRGGAFSRRFALQRPGRFRFRGFLRSPLSRGFFCRRFFRL
jgi:hypothetical protein